MSNRSAVILSGGTTTSALTPLLLDKYDVIVLDDAIGETQHQKYGDRVIPFQQKLTPQLQEIAHNEAVRRAVPILAHWEENIRPFIAQSMDPWFRSFVVSNLTRQLLRGFALNVLSEEREIILLVTHEDVTEFFGGMAMWAKGRGIRTLHVPHGNCYMNGDMTPDLHETSICDAIAGTPHMKQFYTERGYTGIIRSTGSPVFDRWADYRVDRNWAAHALGLEPTKPTITYFSSWSQLTNVHSLGEGFDIALRSVFEVAKKQSYQLIIKLHPYERQGLENMYATIAQQHGVPCLVTRTYWELCLSCSDMLIAFGPSNALLDAAILGRQALSLRIRGFDIPHIPQFLLEQSVESTARALAEEVEHFLHNPADLQPAIEQYVGAVDGKATERIAHWILKGKIPCK